MVTHAELVSAFGSDWVETMPPEVAERHFGDPEDRRVLTEVGLPGSLMEVLFFGDLGTEQPRTIAQVLDIGEPGSDPPDIEDDIVIVNSIGGLACLSQAEHHIYWYKPGDEKRNRALINSSLELFVETLYRVWLRLKDLNLEYASYDEESPAEIGAELRRLVAEICDIDPPSFESPVMYWQHVLLFALKLIAEE
ncbi:MULTISPECIES: SUKH-4 family immunity protein [Thermomonosporaceae]|uniref:SUKH-4 family immunity protein n=1 Tax=Thermomonosporaceae TaxID=2012 RepID=UPI00255A8C09|nr:MULTISPECIES: SUKH-4 family immunity protein [Thermomonosporaceae]MDL4776598.1 SUKH-4 family immunity protein [Actinomadura xylanilytica]